MRNPDGHNRGYLGNIAVIDIVACPPGLASLTSYLSVLIRSHQALIRQCHHDKHGLSYASPGYSLAQIPKDQQILVRYLLSWRLIFSHGVSNDQSIMVAVVSLAVASIMWQQDPVHGCQKVVSS